MMSAWICAPTTGAENNNNISLICRYDPEVGWYEFNIANNGLYNIFYAEITSSGKIAYNRIANGGSNSIKQGKDVNEYGASCVGNELTLYINGDEVISYPEKKYGLRSGRSVCQSHPSMCYPSRSRWTGSR